MFDFKLYSVAMTVNYELVVVYVLPNANNNIGVYEYTYCLVVASHDEISLTIVFLQRHDEFDDGYDNNWYY